MTSFNVTHPELKEGEIFLGNFPEGQAIQVGWKTKRIGWQSYDKDGLAYSGSRPVFVQIAELPQTALASIKEFLA
jgi:hypothetical protein